MIIQMPEEVLFKLVDYAKGLGKNALIRSKSPNL